MGGFKNFRNWLFDQGHPIPVLDFASGDWKQGLKGTANMGAQVANIAGSYYGMPVNIGRPFDNDKNTPLFSGREGIFDKVSHMVAGAAGARGSGGGKMAMLSGAFNNINGGYRPVWRRKPGLGSFLPESDYYGYL
jgi:hypothetical protein